MASGTPVRARTRREWRVAAARRRNVADLSRESPAARPARRGRCVKRQRAGVLGNEECGSPEDTDLERNSLADPRIKHMSATLEKGPLLPHHDDGTEACEYDFAATPWCAQGSRLEGPDAEILPE